MNRGCCKPYGDPEFYNQGVEWRPVCGTNGVCPECQGKPSHAVLTAKLNANFELLTALPANSEEAKALRHEQANLLTARMALTIGDANKIVEE